MTFLGPRSFNPFAREGITFMLHVIEARLFTFLSRRDRCSFNQLNTKDASVGHY